MYMVALPRHLDWAHPRFPESPSLYVPDDSVSHAYVMKSQISAQKSLVELPRW